MLTEYDFGPFPIGTLCLCVRSPRYPDKIGRECVVVEHRRYLYNVDLTVDYIVEFGDGEQYAGLWSQRNIIAIGFPAGKVETRSLATATKGGA